MSFVALIPARLKSTRLPDKPLADIHGKPMIVRVAERAKLSGASRVVVAADDPRILDAVRAHGFEAVLTRPDHASGTERLAEAADILALADDEIVVNVQGDEPLIDPVLIDAVAEKLAADAGLVMSTAAHPIESAADFFNPNAVKVVLDRTGRALYFSRAPIPWARDEFARPNIDQPARDEFAQDQSALPANLGALRHIGIYGYRAGFLRAYSQLAASPIEGIEALEQLRVLWHGHSIGVFVAAHAPAAGVDTQEDLERVRAVFR